MYEEQNIEIGGWVFVEDGGRLPEDIEKKITDYINGYQCNQGICGFDYDLERTKEPDEIWVILRGMKEVTIIPGEKEHYSYLPELYDPGSGPEVDDLLYKTDIQREWENFAEGLCNALNATYDDKHFSFDDSCEISLDDDDSIIDHYLAEGADIDDLYR